MTHSLLTESCQEKTWKESNAKSDRSKESESFRIRTETKRETFDGQEEEGDRTDLTLPRAALPKPTLSLTLSLRSLTRSRQQQLIALQFESRELGENINLRWTKREPHNRRERIWWRNLQMRWVSPSTF
jgi:hypothetical protein